MAEGGPDGVGPWRRSLTVGRDPGKIPRVRDDVPVLVVGGSLVGLSTALFLGAQGVETLVVERHPGTAIHPRAALFNQRTIELYRSVGLEDAIREASQREFEQNGAIVSVESLGGRELEWFFRNVNEGFEELSPSPRLFITQIGLEPILRRRAEELGARLAWGTEVTELRRDGEGVTATVRRRDDGSVRAIRARFAVAADGSRSPVRERLGIPLRGHPGFSRSITIYFRADVRELIGERNLSVVYVFNPKLQGFFRFSKEGDAGFLVVNTTVDADGRKNRNVWDESSDERCVDYVRDALGAPELPIEIENVQRWIASAEWAERFQDGPIFLVGDAAHAMPPTGGFGGNTGVADAHNLAWKLAAVLAGSAGPRLLDTYDAERRPVAELTCEQAYTRYVLRLDPDLGAESLQPFVPDPPIELGHRYRSGAVVPEPGVEDDGAPFEDPTRPSGRPGTRAPHVPLADGSSTLDLVGRGFALLAGSRGQAWCQAARAVDVAAQRIESPAVERAYGLEPDGASLVRPDGFVGWRSRGAGDPTELVAAIDAILAR